MRSNEFKRMLVVWMFSVVMGGVHGQTLGIKTVDQFLMQENQRLMEQDRRLSAGASSESTGETQPVSPELTVQSLYGSNGDLRANVTFNGTTHERVQVGRRIGACVVASVADQCVTLLPVSRGRTGAGQCPKSCWTGQTAASSATPPAPVAGNGALPGDFPSAGVVGQMSPMP